jgi:hypothetical protein
MGWAARAKHRAIAEGRHVPVPRMTAPTRPPVPRALDMAAIGSALREFFGMTPSGRTTPSRRERYLEREARRQQRTITD